MCPTEVPCTLNKLGQFPRDIVVTTYRVGNGMEGPEGNMKKKKKNSAWTNTKQIGMLKKAQKTQQQQQFWLVKKKNCLLACIGFLKPTVGCLWLVAGLWVCRRPESKRTGNLLIRLVSIVGGCFVAFYILENEKKTQEYVTSLNKEKPMGVEN